MAPTSAVCVSSSDTRLRARSRSPAAPPPPGKPRSGPGVPSTWPQCSTTQTLPPQGHSTGTPTGARQRMEGNSVSTLQYSTVQYLARRPPRRHCHPRGTPGVHRWVSQGQTRGWAAVLGRDVPPCRHCHPGAHQGSRGTPENERNSVVQYSIVLCCSLTIR